ncbi:MAG: DNA/RNA non-specific endonuclease [Nostoc indistinguendum CM1-VF10]|jgi:hypothetical protein|nr:DNA/RNA non-specific endonuclease [Nostoc indistinguendum CM1-VF10]
MPSEVNAFYQEGRQLYINRMDGVINKVVAIISRGLTQAKAEITKGKQEIQNYVNQLPQDLKAVGQQAAADIDSKFDALEQSVKDKENELIETLAQKYQENLEAVDARIDEMKAANQGLVQKALDAVVGVIKTIIELTKMLMQVLGRVAGVVEQILKDPIGFLGNLIQALKQGFLNFMNNIGKHLKKGLIGWLTGTMAESGFEMPEKFDLKGIFGLVSEVLGFTYQVIRAQAVKRLGEKKVGHLEQNFDIFQVLASEGVAGIWQFVQDRIGDLNELVIKPIKDFVIETVIFAGVEWVLSLLTPASAFVKAAKAIYQIISFFIERAQQIASLINAILDAVSAIASGAIDQAVKGVENALAKSLPVVISFLASLLGLGGIAGKVQAIFQKLRKPVEKAVDWIIDKGAKAANKVGNKFNKSKFGKKANAVKESALKKKEAAQEWANKKKETAQQKFGEKKQAINNRLEEKKNQLRNTKAGKKLAAVNEAAQKKLDALEEKRQAFNDKVEAAKEWPAKKLEALENKAGKLRVTAKDKFKQSKFSQKLKAGKEDKLLEWKEQGKNKLQEIGSKRKDKKGKEGKENKSELEKKHAQMGNAAAQELAKKPSKEMSYEHLRASKENQAKALENKYNKQLEKPVKMTITFKPPVEDEKDGNMDFHIHIGPNNFDTDGAVQGVGKQNTAERFKEELAKADPAAQADMLKALKQNAKEYDKLESWEAVKAKLSNDGRVKDFLEKPLLKEHKFGLQAHTNQAVPAVNRILGELGDAAPQGKTADDLVTGYKDQVHSSKAPFTNSQQHLANQVFDASQKSAASNALYTEFKEKLEKGDNDLDHTRYYPEHIEEKPNGKGTQITYVTRAGKSFRVNLDENQMVRAVKGFDLQLKGDAGIDNRGTTQDPDTKVKGKGQHSSHLIADQFMGSGYKKSLNLIAASSEFNLGPMSGAEDDIKAFIRRNKAITFDMQVTVTWGELDNNKVVGQIMQELQALASDDKRSGLKNLDQAGIKAEILKNLQGAHKNLNRCMNVLYKVTVKTETGASIPMREISTGPDLWLGL